MLGVGSFELFRGPRYLSEYLAIAQTPMVSTNMRFAPGSALDGLVSRHVVLETQDSDGVVRHVGVLGFSDQDLCRKTDCGTGACACSDVQYDLLNI